MAASRGLEKSILVVIAEMMSTSKGACFGLLEEGGARIAALSRAAFISGGSSREHHEEHAMPGWHRNSWRGSFQSKNWHNKI